MLKGKRTIKRNGTIVMFMVALVAALSVSLIVAFASSKYTSKTTTSFTGRVKLNDGGTFKSSGQSKAEIDFTVYAATKAKRGTCHVYQVVDRGNEEYITGEISFTRNYSETKSNASKIIHLSFNQTKGVDYRYVFAIYPVKKASDGKVIEWPDLDEKDKNGKYKYRVTYPFVIERGLTLTY